MKHIKLLRNEYHFNYPEDVERIVQAMENEGYICSVTEAHAMWEEYSQSMCAGWMNVGDDLERIVDCIREYFIEI